ncbi:DNA ligase [Mesorhizobium sp.]|uniref:DNA ligase n=1 Tax=Mesorhizobium sp. TaxID=1871066 RepID=UPI0025B7C257|nr:DNA ligase [Mesorhizobium sp.]
MRNAHERLKFIRPLKPGRDATSQRRLAERDQVGRFRTQIILDLAGARAFSRNGFDWSTRYWPIVATAEKLPARAFILDGKMIAPEPDGRPNFQQMHSRMTWNAEQLTACIRGFRHSAPRRPGSSLAASDRAQGEAMGPGQTRQGDLQYSEHVEGGGAAFFEAVEKMGLEGMVSKRRGSPYKTGKLDSWVKTKCWELGEFELLGIRRESGKPAAAIMTRNGRYAGAAAVTLPSGLRERLWQRVQADRATKPSKRVPRAFADDVEWVKPGITGRVKFLRGEHILRHASLEGFREDLID